MSGLTWEQDAPEHWGADGQTGLRVSVWQRSDGAWIWELWLPEESDNPAVSHVADSFEEAKAAAEREMQTRCAERRRVAEALQLPPAAVDYRVLLIKLLPHVDTYDSLADAEFTKAEVTELKFLDHFLKSDDE